MALTDNLSDNDSKLAQLRNLNSKFDKISGAIGRDQDAINTSVGNFDPLNTTDSNEFASAVDGMSDFGLPTSVADINDKYQSGLGIASSVTKVATDLGLPPNSTVDDIMTNMNLPNNTSLDDVLKVAALSSDSSFGNMAETLGFRTDAPLADLLANMKLPDTFTKDDLLKMTKAGFSPETTNIAAVLANASSCFPGVKEAFKNITPKEGLLDINFPKINLHFPSPPIKFPTLPKLPTEKISEMANKIGDSIGDAFAALGKAEDAITSGISKLKGAIAQSGIGKLIAKMDSLINCLTSTGYETAEVAAIADNINTVTTELNLKEELDDQGAVKEVKLDGEAYVQSLPQDNPDLIANIQVAETKHEEKETETTAILTEASSTQVTQNNAPIIEQKAATVPDIPPKNAGNIDPVSGLPLTTYADNMVITCQGSNHGYTLTANAEGGDIDKTGLLTPDITNRIAELQTNRYTLLKTLTTGNVLYDIFYRDISFGWSDFLDTWLFVVTITLDIDKNFNETEIIEYEINSGQPDNQPSDLLLKSKLRDAWNRYAGLYQVGIGGMDKAIVKGFTTAPSRETAK